MSKRLLSFVVLAAAGLHANATIELRDGELSYSQDFNALVSTGTSSALPAGWFINEIGTSATVNGSYSAGTGSANTGDIYSFGAAGSSDRALGSLLSSSFTGTFGASFTNLASSSITSLLISYQGEQWRLGATGRADRLAFQYSTDATSLTTGTWTDFTALDFSSLVTTGTVGALIGDTNTATVTSTLSGLNLATNSTVWIRWTDINASGSDDGLAVDNFSLTATLAPVPEPSSYALLLAGLGVVGMLARRRGSSARQA